ncbi:MBL fold metallo-hydrolase [Alicyclobacillus sp. ALC3]|uniref:MBL fold metallo-hydrolase n=1 Tax=Alicyclobacillus sp. ALC3 TaxID=2796143 RepID=UPI002379D2FE|nr:MBL fold metallo-hydrolase [Alicyclobacillus sp. ALC3]WDL96194.1 MBL fold metallo-hydrolase [Alicyclobacillus sp. ALC3]
MQLATFVISPIRSNCYILSQDEAVGRDAVVIDPGDTALDAVFAYIREHQLNVTAVWNTHAHFDHVMGVDLVRAKYGAPAYVHPADMPIWDNVAQATQEMFARSVPALNPPDGSFEDGQKLTLGSDEFTIWHTPGHSPGSVCIVGERMAFTGDTLFAGTIGATHFYLGDAKAMETSLRKLLQLRDDLELYPGHGQPTSMGRERTSNMFLVQL